MIEITPTHYWIDQKPFVRVTEIISAMANDDLTDWKAKRGFDDAEAYSKEKRDVGTEAHALIRDMVNDKRSFSDTPAHIMEWNLLSGEVKYPLMAWYQSQMPAYDSKKKKVWDGYEPVTSEIIMSSELGFAGTCDCLIKTGKTYRFADWKTGGIFQPKRNLIYPEIPLQLCAYDHLWEENYPEIELEGGIVIRLNRETGKFDPKQTYYQSRKRSRELFPVFMQLFGVWEYSQEARGEC